MVDFDMGKSALKQSLQLWIPSSIAIVVIWGVYDSVSGELNLIDLCLKAIFIPGVPVIYQWLKVRRASKSNE